MTTPAPRPRIGTAGWNVPAAMAHLFPPGGSHLERYAQVMDCVEIDSAFYRPHRTSTYERWAAATPSDFRFSVKLPREITHRRRLRQVDDALDVFLEQVGGLGDRLACLLIQLPPSLDFDADAAAQFLESLRSRHAGALACEPRAPGWFSRDADRLLVRFDVTRVAADPAIVAEAARPGGAQAAVSAYYRWHGSPRLYFSRYGQDWLAARFAEVSATPAPQRWFIFDNTAAGAALDDALAFARLFP